MACHNLILTYSDWKVKCFFLEMWLDQLKCYFLNITVVWEETHRFLTFENLQNWDIGASSWGAVPPLELSFWTWVGGTGLCDWPVARYIACTHRIRSCSSSLAKITVSPSLTALKNVRPPSRPERVDSGNNNRQKPFRYAHHSLNCPAGATKLAGQWLRRQSSRM